MFKLKTILLSALILSLSISLSDAMVTIYDSGEFGNDTVTTSVDLDMDGKADKIVAKPNSIKINNKTFDIQSDYILFEMHKFYAVDIIDINKKDNQKEIVMIYSSTRLGRNSIILTYKNNKIEKIAEIQSDDMDFQIDTKNNLLLAGNSWGVRFPYEYNSFFGSWPTTFTKYKLENNTLKNVTPDETNFNTSKGNWNVKLLKPVDVYKDTKATKKLFTSKSGEKLTILSGNLKGKYLKVKNSKGNIGYVPILLSEEPRPLITLEENNNYDYSYSWNAVKALKQYPNINSCYTINTKDSEKVWD
ncbi:hypothetical protein HMPREF9629_00589 [Peptoanaerobacter stomatis]|uniref:SH3b domain-containing protein n=1 Tax=Peptoanaerobacter stomatis TaxID=796937 RepID=G9X2I2_9FIRM|nr:VCBS repeat-containing protein [Peptoanaerobacter stomatis]EHL11052.1 hypothetical protein HMPREF9629_00589 [Peptoanaerobacter stomatis]